MLKELKSSDVKPLQNWNMSFIVVTFDVSNPRTFSDVKPVHSLNMSFIAVTFDVSNPRTSSDVK